MAAEECLSNQKMVEKPTMESRTRATMRTVSEIGFRSSPAFCWWPHIKNTKVAHSKKEHFASATKQKQISPTRYAMTMITSDGSVFCKLFALLFHQFLLIPRQSKSKKLSKLKVFLPKFKILLNLKMFLLNSRFWKLCCAANLVKKPADNFIIWFKAFEWLLRNFWQSDNGEKPSI